MEKILSVLENIKGYLPLIRLADLLDVAIVAYLVYKLLSLVKSTRAANILKGVAIFLAALWLSSKLNLRVVNYILSHMVEWGVLALIIVFQPEIRRILEQLGSKNIRLLRTLAPEKTKHAILAPMKQIRGRRLQNQEELVKYRHAPKFAPAGQSTQMIVGATPDSDLHILRMTQGLYDRYQLKRVFFSAYVPVVESALLPSRETKPPLLREHRLYQADWLLRFYGFRAEELLDEQSPSFDPRLDPKCCWALRHPEFFPVEVNRADYETLLRVPGLGVVSARRILAARRVGALRVESLPKLGVVMKRAQYFLTAGGRMADGLRFTQDTLLRNLIAAEQPLLPQPEMQQLSLFEPAGSLRSTQP